MVKSLVHVPLSVRLPRHVPLRELPGFSVSRPEKLTVPVWICTAPVLLKKLLIVVVPVPADLRNSPAFWKPPPDISWSFCTSNTAPGSL